MRLSIFTTFVLAPLVVIAALLPMAPDSRGEGDDDGVRYVGTVACRPCHGDEHQRFTTHARMSRSYQSIERLRKGLTPEEVEGCYGCHTTAYGRPGGFVSLEETPHLANLSCEVCHGPGSVHVKSAGDSPMKRGLSMEDCEACHISERVKAFRFKPLIYGGAH